MSNTSSCFLSDKKYVDWCSKYDTAMLYICSSCHCLACCQVLLQGFRKANRWRKWCKDEVCEFRSKFQCKEIRTTLFLCQWKWSCIELHAYQLAMLVLSIYMSSGDFFRNLMMDLVIAMTPYVNGKNIKLLYDLALPWLQVRKLGAVCLV